MAERWRLVILVGLSIPLAWVWLSWDRGATEPQEQESHETQNPPPGFVIIGPESPKLFDWADPASH